MIITYHIQTDNQISHRFDIDLERASKSEAPEGSYPTWCQMERNQCSHCPLKSPKHRYCPTAVDLNEIYIPFKNSASYTPTKVVVIAPERNYIKNTDLQSALSTLSGLVMATSACPILSSLHYLARYHVPFATFEESIPRTAAYYLLKQYYKARQGENPDYELKELKNYYTQLTILNEAFSKRIQEAVSEDAGLNAMMNLFSLSSMVSFSIEESLSSFKDFFLKIPHPPD